MTMSASNKQLRLFEGESLLVGLGILGAVLSAVCAVIMLVKGRYIGLEGDLLKPIEFDLALGLFLINVAAFLPLAGFTPRGRVAWRWFNVFLAVYSYAQETIQTLRGIDPRFSHQLHSLLESLPNIIFALVSLLLIVSIVTLVWRVFRNPDPTFALLRTGLKYGLASTLVAVAGGVFMITLAGRYFGTSGNALWIHFIGFEGLKTVMLTAWLAERSPLDRPAAHRMVHIAGIAWLVACAGISWQTVQGLSLFTPTPAVLGTAVSLIAWGAATLRVWPAASAGARLQQSA